MRRLLSIIVASALTLCLGLTACGRKGDLQPPPGYGSDAPAEEEGE